MEKLRLKGTLKCKTVEVFMMETGYIGVPEWANIRKSTREAQHFSNDKKENAQNANCIFKKETYWKSTTSSPVHKAERTDMITSNFFTDIAMIQKPQGITSQWSCKVCMTNTKPLRSRMS